jgi:WD40 repeat protein
VNIIHQFQVCGPIIALQWGSCGVPLRAYARDGHENVLDTSSGCLVRSTSFVAGRVARVVCRPHSDQSSYVTENGILGGLDDNTPELEGVRDINWSPCGRFLAVLNERGLNIWNAERRKTFTYPSEGEDFESLAWNPIPDDGCGQLAATIPSGVLLWSACGALGRRVLPHLAGTTVIAWHPDGRYLALAYQDGAVRIWDHGTNQSIWLHAGGNTVRRLLWDRKGKLLIGIALKSLHLWSLFAAIHCGRDHAWAQHDTPMTDVALRGSGNLLAAGHLDGNVELRRLNAATTLLQSMKFHSSISHLSWSASGTRLAVGVDSGHVYVVRVCR